MLITVILLCPLGDDYSDALLTVCAGDTSYSRRQLLRCCELRQMDLCDRRRAEWEAGDGPGPVLGAWDRLLGAAGPYPYRDQMHKCCHIQRLHLYRW